VLVITLEYDERIFSYVRVVGVDLVSGARCRCG
jgi:hypothetical protein